MNLIEEYYNIEQEVVKDRILLEEELDIIYQVQQRLMEEMFAEEWNT